jgi:hypothetical protein
VFDIVSCLGGGFRKCDHVDTCLFPTKEQRAKSNDIVLLSAMQKEDHMGTTTKIKPTHKREREEGSNDPLAESALTDPLVDPLVKSSAPVQGKWITKNRRRVEVPDDEDNENKEE